MGSELGNMGIAAQRRVIRGGRREVRDRGGSSGGVEEYLCAQSTFSGVRDMVERGGDEVEDAWRMAMRRSFVT